MYTLRISIYPTPAQAWSRHLAQRNPGKIPFAPDMAMMAMMAMMART